MATAVGSISIIDLYDSRILQSFISSNLSKYQLYDSDTGTYDPDWATSNLVLQAEAYISGSAADVSSSADISYIRWYRDNSPVPLTTGGAYTISGTNNRTLTISQNMMSNATSLSYKCEVAYLDRTTNLTLTTTSTIDFIKIVTGGAEPAIVVRAMASTPDGNIFKTGSMNLLRGECNLWRGSNIETEGLTYQWYARDTSVVADEGGGIGWKMLTDTSVGDKYTGTTTSTITIYPNAVANLQTFKCIITDITAASQTYNQKFQDFITIVDMRDPYRVVVESTGGNIFKSGQGSTTLMARVLQGSDEVDLEGTALIYKWYKYDSSGNLVANWGGNTDYKTGKSINITSADVNIKSTFRVEVD